MTYSELLFCWRQPARLANPPLPWEMLASQLGSELCDSAQPSGHRGLLECVS